MLKNFMEVQVETASTERGLALSMFPRITQYTGGMRGLWVIGGMTGTGKSTLARHFAYSLAGPGRDVVYLDLENNHSDKDALDGIIACYDAGLRSRLREHF